MKADADVAKMIGDMEINDAVMHDEMYSDWANRYTDFTMAWKRIQNPTTGVVEGHLVAMGRPRFQHLGKIGDGCTMTLMSGPILDQPLPTTKVGNLRLNHLQFVITFAEPGKFREDEAEDSTIFRVGHKNELYGSQQRKSNRKDFIKKKAEKNASPGELLNNLLQALVVTARGGDNRPHDEGEPGYQGDQQQHGNPSQYQSSSQFRDGRSRDGDRNWSNPMTSSDHPQFQQRFTTTAAME